MGEVYLAEHQLLKRPCAIKLIRHDLIGNHRIFARFEREVRATAQLSHWNTIEIFDYGRNDNGAFYYVMEYLPGLSLAELVERFGPMPAARVIYLLRQACDALHEAHEAGLVHRDIKPANLMAAYRGGLHDVTKILDFGLVKTLSENENAPHLSREGTVAGSPLYMAPEQIMHTHEPDRRTDIYALGRRRLLHVDRQAALQGRQPDGGHDRARPRRRHSAFADPSGYSRRPRTRRSPLPGQEPGRSLPGYAEPRRRPGPLCRRGQLVAASTPPSGGKPTHSEARRNSSCPMSRSRAHATPATMSAGSTAWHAAAADRFM